MLLPLSVEPRSDAARLAKERCWCVEFGECVSQLRPRCCRSLVGVADFVAQLGEPFLHVLEVGLGLPVLRNSVPQSADIPDRVESVDERFQLVEPEQVLDKNGEWRVAAAARLLVELQESSECALAQIASLCEEAAVLDREQRLPRHRAVAAQRQRVLLACPRQLDGGLVGATVD